MYHTHKLDFETILGHIENLAITPQAKMAIIKLKPSMDCYWIKQSQDHLEEMKAILNQSGTIPLNPLTSFNRSFDELTRQMVLSASQIYSIGSFLEDVLRLQRFMQTKASIAPTVSQFALSMHPLTSLAEEIRASVHGETVLDEASPKLAKLRKQIRFTEDKIKDKLRSILQQAGNADLLTDAHIAIRDGRYVIPVKSSAKGRVEGRHLDASKSGNTSFIEPEAVRRLSDQLQQLQIAQEDECFRILAELTGKLAQVEGLLNQNREGFITYDLLSAKAKYAIKTKSVAVSLTPTGAFTLIEARHPELGDQAVPLNLALNGNNMVITGPNTGGKTVVLKTVGLLSLMAMCGLLVPADPRSQLRVFDHILADIGDGQSITQNLSTFSAHIVNIQGIVETATDNSLVLLDEIGSGTEPNEGAGIAMAILEALHRSGATILATTHYTQLKTFAQNTPGFVNGSMLFDAESLKPLYCLSVGEAGKSHALLIALKLGMNEGLLDRAHQLTYGSPFNREAYLDLLQHQHNLQHQRNFQHQGKTLASDKASQIEAPVAGKEVTNQLITDQQITGPQMTGQKASPFAPGDSVYLPALKTSGIVITSANRKGDHTVEVKGKKMILNHKRMKPYIDKKSLYPEDYDMDIVTKSWHQRKTEKALSKGKKVVLEITKDT